MKKIFFQLYNPCGLFNQITSVELGVGLSEITGRQLVWHNINNPPNAKFDGKRVAIYSANYEYNNRGNKIELGVFPKITELMNWKNKEDNVFIDDIVDVFSYDTDNIENLMRYYYSDKENLEFSEGRNLLSLDNEKDWDIRKTLGYYSRFFDNRSKELNNAISSIRFKEEYYQISERIAKSIGDFNGAHLRLADHKPMINTTAESFNQGLSKMSGSLPIVLSTDEPHSDVIKNSDYRVLLLDRYILNNFYEDFKTLPFREEVSFGIVNNLVMHHSKDFIGTPGSTYTGYIHRNLNQKSNIGFKLFCEEDHKITGRYSWNGYTNKDTFTKQWWREWEESKI
jgi:hypothetical protein